MGAMPFARSRVKASRPGGAPAAGGQNRILPTMMSLNITQSPAKE